MGERKGVNKYYPPDFNPAKHGSLNRYHNSHPLRERARKLSQGILIISCLKPVRMQGARQCCHHSAECAADAIAKCTDWGRLGITATTATEPVVLPRACASVSSLAGVVTQL